MAHDNSPSSVMYAELKGLGLSNRDVALTLLQADRSFDGATLRDRIESRSQLSRYIVHVAPAEIGRGLFSDFAQSSQALLGRIIAKRGSAARADMAVQLSQRFSGDSAQVMCEALRAYDIDVSVYLNAVAHIGNLALSSESDRALLYFMLFVVTGCTGDPREGARAVDQFAGDNLGSSFKTSVAKVGIAEYSERGTDENLSLGLMRIVGGKLKGPSAFYPLAATEQGTEIGTLATGAGAITDVDEDVSRRHARIYKQGQRWYIVGMKSTNGTTIISGDDKIEYVVEPPKRERPRDWTPAPYELLPTDTICLGSSTRFMVMPMLG